MRIPRATYRLQFNEHFRLTDALALVPYLDGLGVSHIYASPLFKAAPHSTHGYDVCDYSQLNPELGTEADLERLAEALHARKMGLVVDIVPNHMGIASPENSWWWDVLAHGRKSRFAACFDIDWKPAEKELQGKVLVPILGNEYEAVLKQGELQVTFENQGFVLKYYEHKFPIAPKTAARLPKDAAALKSFNSDSAALDQLIQQQHYRLAYYEHGDVKVNYRRFFAVSTLAAVSVEDEATFEATHALLRKWLDRGWVDGLRVDHPDGLREPLEYLRKLRLMAPDAWIVVEKILETEESLPRLWPVQGTTGYDFLNQVNGVFIDSSAEKSLTDLYAEFTGEPTNYGTLLIEKKRRVLKTLLVAELNRLSGQLVAAAARSEAAREFSEVQLREAVAEVIACFPVYRSYITESDAPGMRDVAVIKTAVHLACENRKDLPVEVFAFIDALLIKPQRGVSARNFVARFQQLTGAVMAKGAEDTAFYCFNRFVSLNEVGGNPGRFGVTVEEFHHYLQKQRNDWPCSQLTTSTHDTKRSEDARARLNVLSEIPELWKDTVQRWSAMNSSRHANDFPDRNAEYLFYQALVGVWPVSEDRMQAYMEKAVHEAKQHTDWTKRNAPYEEALRNFIKGTLHDAKFIDDLEQFINRISEAAAVNSLAQTLIKLTAPGVPDIYQGCELWDFSLVDPDNRRPVDFALRQKLVRGIETVSAEDAWKRRAEGFAKLWLIQKTLKLRARVAGCHDLGYDPVFAQGAKAEHVLAFSRGKVVLPVVPRLFFKLNHDWQDTTLKLPAGDWHDEYGGEIFSGEIRLDKLFQKFPVALLVRKENN